jgi:tetratricopeptide (TPR) repeat protein
VSGSRCRANRIALIVAALALLAGAPAVLAAVHVRNPWVLGGVAALAGVIVVFGSVWQERYRRLVLRRDELALKIEDGCVVLSDGRLPHVRDMTDPVLLGVHKAPPAVIVAGRHGAGEQAREHAPAYVSRDIDQGLRERLAEGGFTLLIGDSTAGKTRAAFEAMTATLPGHLLICPVNRDAVAVAAARAAQAPKCVLWLDDLEGYLGSNGLTAAQLGRLLTGNQCPVIIATLRAAEQARILAGDVTGSETASQVLRDSRQVLDLARPIRLSRMFTGRELERARSLDQDPRIGEALAHAGSYGIAEYLAAGPALLRDWEDARNSSAGPNARGAALVAAAIDIRRAGHTSPIPRALLGLVCESYLNDPEHARTPREPVADAWAWATRQRHATTALLQPAADDCVEVFDYLVDTIQRRTFPGDHVPESVVRTAADRGDPADADSLAATAYSQGRYALAEYAYRRAYQAKTGNPDFGAEHPSTLASRNNLTNVLHDLGRLEEAEAEHHAVLDIRSRVLGPEHPDTLASRGNHALVLHDLGHLDEAEAETRALLEIRYRILGDEHPATLATRGNLASILGDLGRLEEAEAEHSAVLDIRSRLLGAEHPRTLASRNNRALVLRDLGRLEEAEAEHHAVLDIRARVLGPEHPHTLTSRDHRALALRDLGRLEEAEAEHRAVLEIRSRVLPTGHRDTLTSRANLTAVLRELERLDEPGPDTC